MAECQVTDGKLIYRGRDETHKEKAKNISYLKTCLSLIFEHGLKTFPRDDPNNWDWLNV